MIYMIIILYSVAIMETKLRKSGNQRNYYFFLLELLEYMYCYIQRKKSAKMYCIITFQRNCFQFSTKRLDISVQIKIQLPFPFHRPFPVKHVDFSRTRSL